MCYCHHCRHFGELPDGVYCDFCLKFLYTRGRMPMIGEELPTSMQEIYARMGWTVSLA